MTCGLILAAGESRRMGSPKALLDFQGETFLDRLIFLFSARCSPVIVVLGAHRERVLSASRRAAAAVPVYNPDFQRGQLSSMQCGLRAVPTESSGVLFTLVDHPSVGATTISALLSPPHPEPLRIPRYHGRRGHPLWVSPSLVPEFLALPAGAAARDIVTRHDSEIAYIDVDDPGILADIDDPAAYAALISRSIP